MYDPAASWSVVHGCETCSPETDLATINSPEKNNQFSFEYYGTIFMDQFCLVFDPKSPTCVQDFGFFAIFDYNYDINNGLYTFLGLAPISSINGPSFVENLHETGRIENFTVSWQLSDWGSQNNNITFGGNVAGAFAGGLKSNKILSASPWLFNLNYQGCGYSGVKAARNESFIFGSVDPLSFHLAIPKNDYIELKQMWI
jgi:hypothetical protein